MAAVLKHWREAATLIITTPSRLHPATFAARTKLRNESKDYNNNNQCDKEKIKESAYETLMLKRSSKSKFMPNVYVFPGGTAEDNDFSSEWNSVFGKLGVDLQQLLFERVCKNSSKASPMFTRSRQPQFSRIPPEVAFRICAIRETFEESGILIAKKVKEMKKHYNNDLTLFENWKLSSSLSPNEIELVEWRERVNQNPDEFLTMCKEMDLIPDIFSLYEWTNWLTPTLRGGKRFDTIFYLCCLDEKPSTKEDSIETVDHQWIPPSSLLTAHFNNKSSIQLAPPQVYELSRLLNFETADDLMRFAAEREVERVELFFPVIVFCKDHMISLMPGDDLYPENPDFDTPKQIIQYDETIEELNKKNKNFHRTVIKREDRSRVESLEFNIVFKNKHVGPVKNLDKLLKKYVKL